LFVPWFVPPFGYCKSSKSLIFSVDALQNATSVQDSVEGPGVWRCRKEIWPSPKSWQSLSHFVGNYCPSYGFHVFLLLQYPNPFRKSDQAFYHANAAVFDEMATYCHQQSSMAM